MEQIPILKVGRCLLVSIQIDMHDRLAMALQDDLTPKHGRHDRARGVLIDISALDMVDTLHRSHAVEHRRHGARSRRADRRGWNAATVAITLVELGLTLTGIQTALDVDRGLALINRLIDAEGESGAGGAH